MNKQAAKGGVNASTSVSLKVIRRLVINGPGAESREFELRQAPRTVAPGKSRATFSLTILTSAGSTSTCR